MEFCHRELENGRGLPNHLDLGRDQNQDFLKNTTFSLKAIEHEKSK